VITDYVSEQVVILITLIALAAGKVIKTIKVITRSGWQR
jgi:hypothetical protein